MSWWSLPTPETAQWRPEPRPAYGIKILLDNDSFALTLFGLAYMIRVGLPPAFKTAPISPGDGFASEHVRSGEQTHPHLVRHSRTRIPQRRLVI